MKSEVDKEIRYALMQPTFMPWLGWFALLDYVDEFVIYDNAQFSRQSWHQRNKIKTANGPLLLSIPVKHEGEHQPINETKLADTRHLKKIIPAISQSYSKAEYFGEYFPEFVELLEKSMSSGSLLQLNWQIINWASDAIGISTPVKFSSDLKVTGGRGEYVANVGKAVNSKNYVSPLGAREYLTEDIAYFDAQKITIDYLLYEHPEYKQRNGNFVSNCCILDLLFNEGPSSLNIIRSGVNIKSHNSFSSQ